MNPTLQAVFSGKSELGITRTVDPADGPVGRGNRTSGAGLGTGVAYAQLWYDGIEQVRAVMLGSAHPPTETTGVFTTCATVQLPGHELFAVRLF